MPTKILTWLRDDMRHDLWTRGRFRCVMAPCKPGWTGLLRVLVISQDAGSALAAYQVASAWRFACHHSRRHQTWVNVRWWDATDPWTGDGLPPGAQGPGNRFAMKGPAKGQGKGPHTLPAAGAGGAATTHRHHPPTPTAAPPPSPHACHCSSTHIEIQPSTAPTTTPSAIIPRPSPLLRLSCEGKGGAKGKTMGPAPTPPGLAGAGAAWLAGAGAGGAQGPEIASTQISSPTF